MSNAALDEEELVSWRRLAYLGDSPFYDWEAPVKKGNEWATAVRCRKPKDRVEVSSKSLQTCVIETARRCEAKGWIGDPTTNQRIK